MAANYGRPPGRSRAAYGDPFHTTTAPALPEPERWRLPVPGAGFGVYYPLLGGTPALASVTHLGWVGGFRYVCHAKVFWPDGTTERVGAVQLLTARCRPWADSLGWVLLTEGGLAMDGPGYRVLMANQRWTATTAGP
jgi:hypothetical protein